MDRLKKYDFLDENGHRLEDCADYQAIFSEHEAELARVKAAGIEALRRAEQAEARAEKAESDKAALEEDLEAAEKNLKEFSGFIEELLSGLKHRFPVQYADLEGDEYGDDAFSSHDLFQLVIDPAVNAAQKAEAENARLTKMVDWLAEKHIRCAANGEQWYGPTISKEQHVPMYPSKNEAIDALKEAARRAVAAWEE